MKKITQTSAATSANLLLLILLSLSVSAQKLSTVQEASVRAPANAKVDAKLTEWNDTFQAYNKTTSIFYTMANDDKNLYLVIKSTDQYNNNKIIGGGISITINTGSKKKDKDAYVITFPFVNLADLRSQVMQGMRRSGTQNQAPDSATIAAMRKKAVSMAKEIKLLGFTKDVPDSVISIYNEYGIKAMADFDNKAHLIVEMAIPLKYLHLAGQGAAFSYQIKLNGINLNSLFPGAGNFAAASGGGGFGGGGNGGGGFGGGAPASGMGGMGSTNMMADIANMLNPTDFWGKYTLAGK